MACGYIGGNNCEFMQPRSSGIKDVSSPSLVSCIVPYDTAQSGSSAGWENELPNPLDITGQYSSNPALAQLAANTNKSHYATAGFYRQMYRWQNEDEAAVDPDSTGLNNRYNTLTFQGHQAAYNPSTSRYDLVTPCTGHRGDRTYPGCGKVWKGLAKLLDPISYSTPFGATTNRVVTTMGV